MHKLAGIFAVMTALAGTGCTGVEGDELALEPGEASADAETCALHGCDAASLDGPESLPQPGQGPDGEEPEDEAPALPETCDPVLADAIAACADAAVDAVDAMPEDDVLAPLDALQMCTDPDDLVNVRDALCLVEAQPWCGSDAEAFGEAMSDACFTALDDQFTAPLELQRIELSAKTLADLDVAMQQRCPEGLCSAELTAFTYGDQHPTLLETTELATEQVTPELAGSYTHVTAWDLGQDLISLSMTEVMESAQYDLGLGIHDEPVVGRIFGAVPVQPGVDELTESYTALYRDARVVITVTIRQAAD